MSALGYLYCMQHICWCIRSYLCFNDAYESLEKKLDVWDTALEKLLEQWIYTMIHHVIMT